jgi:acyl-CoA synthetase (NDP forming)
VRVFGIYVEGFRALDGIATIKAIERIAASGRTVILYRAGRTQAGARASASHTACVAGDYVVTRELAGAAGAVVAETLEDFTDLIVLFTLLDGRPPKGRRLGALSNGGYQCVAFADNLGGLELAAFTDDTCAKLAALLDVARVGTIVDVHNPLDLTPIVDDSGFATAVRRVLEDEQVDVGVIGCVPLTPALNTLAPAAGHDEDFGRCDSIASRLVRLKDEIPKPWVVVVDAGPLYEPFLDRLQTSGVPTLRSPDRAVRLLNIFVDEGLRTVERSCAARVDEFARPGMRV